MHERSRLRTEAIGCLTACWKTLFQSVDDQASSTHPGCAPPGHAESKVEPGRDQAVSPQSPPEIERLRQAAGGADKYGPSGGNPRVQILLNMPFVAAHQPEHWGPTEEQAEIACAQTSRMHGEVPADRFKLSLIHI
eukprot:8197168-Alexandrium_andersonii.AAC.1